jgi:hypothetical protein
VFPGAGGYVAQKRFIFITFYGRGRRTVCAIETISEWQPGTIPQKFFSSITFSYTKPTKGRRKFPSSPRPRTRPLLPSLLPSLPKNGHKSLIPQSENSARPSLVSCTIFGSRRPWNAASIGPRGACGPFMVRELWPFLPPSLPGVIVGRYT